MILLQRSIEFLFLISHLKDKKFEEIGSMVICYNHVTSLNFYFFLVRVLKFIPMLKLEILRL